LTGFEDLVTGFGVSSPLASVGSPLPTSFSWDFPDPFVPNFFPELSHVSSSCGGPLSAYVVSTPLLQGFQYLNVIFLGTFPFPDAGLGIDSLNLLVGVHSEGFIAPYLPLEKSQWMG
jgi:hypothetical protein